MLTDFFTGSPFVVELEKDLSLHHQLLDVVILRKRKGRLTERLPDGLDDLADHNLITFKSHHEALDDWALKELTGHYVNYCKQLAPGDEPLLPESAFRLYAVCSRFPHNLAQTVPWETIQPGVYRCRRGTDEIRVVVASQLPQAAHNAALHLCSAAVEQITYGARHYRQHTAETSTLLNRFVQGYQGEGLPMSYTLKDFRRDCIKNFLKELTPDERRKALQSVPPEERLEGLSPEEIEQFFVKIRAERGAGERKSKKRK